MSEPQKTVYPRTKPVPTSKNNLTSVVLTCSESIVWWRMVAAAEGAGLEQRSENSHGAALFFICSRQTWGPERPTHSSLLCSEKNTDRNWKVCGKTYMWDTPWWRWIVLSKTILNRLLKKVFLSSVSEKGRMHPHCTSKWRALFYASFVLMSLWRETFQLLCRLV